jgi:hypothetical protein
LKTSNSLKNRKKPRKRRLTLLFSTLRLKLRRIMLSRSVKKLRPKKNQPSPNSIRRSRLKRMLKLPLKRKLRRKNRKNLLISRERRKKLPIKLRHSLN